MAPIKVPAAFVALLSGVSSLWGVSSDSVSSVSVSLASSVVDSADSDSMLALTALTSSAISS